MLTNKLLILFLLFSFLFSCSPEEQPINKQEAISFARQIEKSIQKRKPGLFDSILHEQSFGEKIANEAGEKSNKDFIKGVIKSLRERRFGNEILSSIGSEGTYEFLHHYEKNKKHHLVFRLYSPEGLNYHDIELIKFNDRIKASDVYLYLSGENLSKTMATVLSSIEGLTKTKGKKKIDQYSKAVLKIRALAEARKFEEAKSLYDNLPKELKQEKIYHLMNIQITSEIDQESYTKALKEYESSFGNDPASQLTLLDIYFINQDYEKALKAIDIIDKGVKDPFLNFYRALVYNGKNDNANAIKHLEVLYKEKPEFGEGIIELIAQYIEASELEKAKNLVAKYKRNKNYNQEALEDLRILYPTFTSKVGL